MAIINYCKNVNIIVYINYAKYKYKLVYSISYFIQIIGQSYFIYIDEIVSRTRKGNSLPFLEMTAFGKKKSRHDYANFFIIPQLLTNCFI